MILIFEQTTEVTLVSAHYILNNKNFNFSKCQNCEFLLLTYAIDTLRS